MQVRTRTRRRRRETVVGRETVLVRYASRNEPALKEGQVRCPVCSNGVALRADGTMRAHSSAPKVSCPGAQPAASMRIPSLCGHGNAPRERTACGCRVRS